MTATWSGSAVESARRLLFSRADLDVLGELLPGDLPAPLMPDCNALFEPAAPREAVLHGLVARGVLTGAHQVVAPFARTWALLANPVTTVEVTVSGRGPNPDASSAVGQHAWLALAADAAASMRTVDPHRMEMSVFLPIRLANELQGLIAAPATFRVQRSVSITTALIGDADGPGVVADVGTAGGAVRVSVDAPDAEEITRNVRANLRCTVMTRTARGPAAGTITWIATPSDWWQVDLDWRRWQRTGEKQTVMTRIAPDGTGTALAGEIRRLLRAGAGLAPATVAGSGRRARRTRRSPM